MLVVPIFCREVTLLPPWIQAVPLLLPGKLSDVTNQLVPLLTNRIALLVCVTVHELNPSIVCDETVAIVNVEELELVFFTQYILPWQVVASGNVNVAADVPVNTSILSVDAAVVLAENDVYLADNEPLISNVELGAVVPIPICAFAFIIKKERINKRIRFFIIDGIGIIRFIFFIYFFVIV